MAICKNHRDSFVPPGGHGLGHTWFSGSLVLWLRADPHCVSHLISHLRSDLCGGIGWGVRGLRGEKTCVCVGEISRGSGARGSSAWAARGVGVGGGASPSDRAHLIPNQARTRMDTGFASGLCGICAVFPRGSALWAVPGAMADGPMPCQRQTVEVFGLQRGSITETFGFAILLFVC